MNQSPVPQDVEKITKQKSVKEQLRETHATSVAMGATGPAVLFGAFLSSSFFLMYRGVRSAATWVEQKVRAGRT